MRSRLLWLILLILLILLLLWLLKSCQSQPDPMPEPEACNGVRTYTSTPAAVIPEALPPGPGTPQSVTDTIAISEMGTINDINFNITARVPEHGELILELMSPNGTSVTMLSTEGGPGDGLHNVTFDDEAAGLPPDFVVNGTCLVGETYQPAPDSLSDFDNESVTGTWTLVVSDAFVGDAVDCGLRRLRGRSAVPADVGRVVLGDRLLATG